MPIRAVNIAAHSRDFLQVSTYIILMKSENEEQVKKSPFITMQYLPLFGFVGFELPFNQNRLGNLNMS